MLISLVLSHSRGGLFSVGISLLLLVFFLLNQRRPPANRLTTLILATVLLIMVFLSGELISRFSYSFRDAPERIGVWKDATKIAKDFPLWGTGLGTFKYVLPNYRQKVDILMVDGVPRQASWNFAHNDYLQLLVECGFLGLVLAGWAIVLWCRQFHSGLKSYRMPRTGTSATAWRVVSLRSSFTVSWILISISLPMHCSLRSA